MTSTWREFWSREHKIYVSPRHIEIHYKALGDGILAHIPVHRPLTLLDWGCGEALAAPVLQASGVRVLLHDPVPYVYERIRARFSKEPHIQVLDTQEMESLKPHSIDAVLIFSVLQYVSKDDFRNLLPRLRELLVPGGVLLLGDIVPSSLSIFADAFDLLRTGLRYGFFFEAVGGIISTLFSDYRSVRHTSGFTTYHPEEMLELLSAQGFSAEIMTKNIGFNEHRLLIKAVVP